MDIWLSSKLAASDDVSKEDLLQELERRQTYQRGFADGMEAAKQIVAAVAPKA